MTSDDPCRLLDRVLPSDLCRFPRCGRGHRSIAVEEEEKGKRLSSQNASKERSEERNETHIESPRPRRRFRWETSVIKESRVDSPDVCESPIKSERYATFEKSLKRASRRIIQPALNSSSSSPFSVPSFILVNLHPISPFISSCNCYRRRRRNGVLTGLRSGRLRRRSRVGREAEQLQNSHGSTRNDS